MLVVIDGTSVGGTKSFTLDLKVANINTSDKGSQGYTNRMRGQRDWSVAFDGLYDPSGVLNFEQLFDMLDAANTQVFLEMACIDGTGGGEKYSGYAVPAGLTLVANMEDAVTVSGNFEADGPLDKGTVASS